MNTKRIVLITLVLALLLGLGISQTATATSAGGPVYKLEWLDAFYEGSGLIMPKTVTAAAWMPDPPTITTLCSACS